MVGSRAPGMGFPLRRRNAAFLVGCLYERYSYVGFRRASGSSCWKTLGKVCAKDSAGEHVSESVNCHGGTSC
jgi:hypothetical protein